jgi:cytoskeletal protein RodZ
MVSAPVQVVVSAGSVSLARAVLPAVSGREFPEASVSAAAANGQEPHSPDVRTAAMDWLSETISASERTAVHIRRPASEPSSHSEPSAADRPKTPNWVGVFAAATVPVTLVRLPGVVPVWMAAAVPFRVAATKTQVPSATSAPEMPVALPGL